MRADFVEVGISVSRVFGGLSVRQNREILKGSFLRVLQQVTSTVKGYYGGLEKGHRDQKVFVAGVTGLPLQNKPRGHRCLKL